MTYRKQLNKGHSAAKFRKQVGKTKGANLQVMRGGIRL